MIYSLDYYQMQILMMRCVEIAGSKTRFSLGNMDSYWVRRRDIFISVFPSLDCLNCEHAKGLWDTPAVFLQDLAGWVIMDQLWHQLLSLWSTDRKKHSFHQSLTHICCHFSPRNRLDVGNSETCFTTQLCFLFWSCTFSGVVPPGT